MLNKEGGGRFRAFSAGSQPKGEPHPLALQSQTVKTKSMTGASGPANSSHDFERRPSVGWSLSRL
jgi:arsenate reductase